MRFKGFLLRYLSILTQIENRSESSGRRFYQKFVFEVASWFIIYKWEDKIAWNEKKC